MNLPRSVPDGCEWSPTRNAAAYADDPHLLSTPATVLVGSDGNFRLCADCAALPRFLRFKKTPIRTKTETPR